MKIIFKAFPLSYRRKRHDVHRISEKLSFNCCARKIIKVKIVHFNFLNWFVSFATLNLRPYEIKCKWNLSQHSTALIKHSSKEMSDVYDLQGKCTMSTTGNLMCRIRASFWLRTRSKHSEAIVNKVWALENDLKFKFPSSIRTTSELAWHWSGFLEWTRAHSRCSCQEYGREKGLFTNSRVKNENCSSENYRLPLSLHLVSFTLFRRMRVYPQFNR